MTIGSLPNEPVFHVAFTPTMAGMTSMSGALLEGGGVHSRPTNPGNSSISPVAADPTNRLS
jgi:hypothetical protein